MAEIDHCQGKYPILYDCQRKKGHHGDCGPVYPPLDTSPGKFECILIVDSEGGLGVTRDVIEEAARMIFPNGAAVRRMKRIG